MPLDVERLPASQLANYADAEAFRAAVLLWCEAWKSVPAASLPDSDLDLRSIVGLQRQGALWEKIKDDALRGFVKCSDGRLYHRFLAEKAVKAWGKRLEYRKRGQAGAKAKGKHTPPENEAAAEAQLKRNSSKVEGRSKKVEGRKTPQEYPDNNSTLNGCARETPSRVFDIEYFLEDADRQRFRRECGGWDIHHFIREFNAFIREHDPPDRPVPAFFGFVKKRTDGKPAPRAAYSAAG